MRMAKVFAVVILLAALLLAAAPPAAAQVVAQVPVIDSIFHPRPGGDAGRHPGQRIGLLQVPLFSTVTFNGVDAVARSSGPIPISWSSYRRGPPRDRWWSVHLRCERALRFHRV